MAFNLIKRTGGVDTSEGANATAAQVLTGYSVYVDDEKINGSMVNQGNKSSTLAVNGTRTIEQGWHNGQGKVTQSIPTYNGVNGADGTYTPTTANKTIINANTWTLKAAYVNGDGNLVAGNIKKGANIFGVVGTYAGTVTSDANVTAAQVLTGYSIYGSAGSKINGSMANQGTKNYTLAANGTQVIPAGWHSGSGKVTQSLATQAGKTQTPGTGNILLCSKNKWTTGNINVAGASTLIAGNIKKGVNIFGITGTYVNAFYDGYNLMKPGEVRWAIKDGALQSGFTITGDYTPTYGSYGGRNAWKIHVFDFWEGVKESYYAYIGTNKLVFTTGSDASFATVKSRPVFTLTYRIQSITGPKWNNFSGSLSGTGLTTANAEETYRAGESDFYTPYPSEAEYLTSSMYYLNSTKMSLYKAFRPNSVNMNTQPSEESQNCTAYVWINEAKYEMRNYT